MTTSNDQPGSLIHDMPVEVRPIEEAVPMPGNPRIGNRPMLSQSLNNHGQYRPIVIQKSTGHIIAGNNTWHAAKEQGWHEIGMQTLDVDDEKAKKINAVDNRTNDLAGYDNRLLVEFLAELDDLDGTGYDPGDYDALVQLVNQEPGAIGDGSDDDDQALLDDTDRQGWPTIRAQVSPQVHQRWQLVDGSDDATKVATLLDAAGY